MKLFLITIVITFTASVSYAAVASDYLILQQIGPYRLTRGYMSMGVRVNDRPMVREGGNEVEGTYVSYKTVYVGEEGLPRPFAEIQVHQNTQWLEHKLQR